jgi:hypothetical protein
MVLTVSFAISLVSRALLPPSPARVSRQLDISVGISGPRDFAVRAACVRHAHEKRPPHPAPNVRDDREAPLFIERGMAGMMVVIWAGDQCASYAALWHDGQIRWPAKILSRFFSFKHKQSNCFVPCVNS